MKPEWQAKDVRTFNQIEPDLTYTFFNFRDPLVGGFSKEKIALRRAIIMGYNLDEEIASSASTRRCGRSCRSLWRRRPRSELAAAQQLRPGPRQPAARPLRLQEGQGRLPHAPRRQAARAPVLNRHRAIDRQYNELWKKSMDGIGIRIEFLPGKFADNLKPRRRAS